MRQKERNKTRFYDRGQQVVNMEEEEGILFSRGVEVHVDKCLRFYCGVPKFRGARRSVYRHAVKGIDDNFLHFGRVQLKFFTVFLNATM